jgi:hypothetical protein
LHTTNEASAKGESRAFGIRVMEATCETTGPWGQVPHPGIVVGLQQGFLPRLQGLLVTMLRQEPRTLDLHPNEFPSGNTFGSLLAFQPVSESEARRVLIGIRQDTLEQRLSLCHVRISV